MIVWRGIKKVMEEMGELLCVFGKLEVVPVGTHWDEKHGAKPLRERCMEECVDLHTALEYFIERNFTPAERARMKERQDRKMHNYEQWVLDGIWVDERHTR